jgi:hypothetical protein
MAFASPSYISRSDGTRWTPYFTHPKFGTHCSVHTVHTRAHPICAWACTLINSSFGTRWNPYFRTPQFGTPKQTPKTGRQNGTPIRDANSGRQFGTHCKSGRAGTHRISHNFTQLHKYSQQKYFLTRFHTTSHRFTIIHTLSQ